MRFPRVSGVEHVWLMIALLSALALGAPCAAAVTLDGFVTNINAATSFDVGATHVDLNELSHCEIQRVFRSKMPVWGGNGWEAPRLSKPRKRTFVACGIQNLPVGSRVHLVGTLGEGGHFVANEMTVYSMRSEEILEGGALLEEPPTLQRNTQVLTDTSWIDGYPMSITAQTKLLGAPAGTTFRYQFNIPLEIHARLRSHWTKRFVSANSLRSNTWVIYHAISTKLGSVIADQLRIWANEVDEREKSYLKNFCPRVIPADYSRNVPGTITYGDARSITIIPNQTAQTMVSDLGVQMIPTYQKELHDTDSTKIHFHFYVVKTFSAISGRYFVETSGLMPHYELLYWDKTSSSFYRKPQPAAVVKEIIASPDGTVFIPDRVLASLQTEAQLAALLSYAITSIVQTQVYHSWPRYLIPNVLERNVGSSYGDAATSWPVGLWQNEQVLRIGIRQMYLAGSDIREAPYAWAVAQGKPVNNPIIDSKHPDKEIPWYAAYAFNYISQYYQDVDYSKLKRGRAEYQQFLKELYKADPSLPAPKTQE